MNIVKALKARGLGPGTVLRGRAGGRFRVTAVGEAAILARQKGRAEYAIYGPEFWEVEVDGRWEPLEPRKGDPDAQG